MENFTNLDEETIKLLTGIDITKIYDEQENEVSLFNESKIDYFDYKPESIRTLLIGRTEEQEQTYTKKHIDTYKPTPIPIQLIEEKYNQLQSLLPITLKIEDTDGPYGRLTKVSKDLKKQSFELYIINGEVLYYNQPTAIMSDMILISDPPQFANLIEKYGGNKLKGISSIRTRPWDHLVGYINDNLGWIPLINIIPPWFRKNDSARTWIRKKKILNIQLIPKELPILLNTNDEIKIINELNTIIDDEEILNDDIRNIIEYDILKFNKKQLLLTLYTVSKIKITNSNIDIQNKKPKVKNISLNEDEKLVDITKKYKKRTSKRGDKKKLKEEQQKAMDNICKQ